MRLRNGAERLVQRLRSPPFFVQYIRIFSVARKGSSSAQMLFHDLWIDAEAAITFRYRARIASVARKASGRTMRGWPNRPACVRATGRAAVSAGEVVCVMTRRPWELMRSERMGFLL
jgi:hypothetical protein